MSDTSAPETTSSVRLSLSSNLLTAVGVLFLILFVIGLLTWRVLRDNVSVLHLDELAPDFTLETFQGDTVSLQDFRGQGVVLNFWASWCNPCREEADLLENTWRAEQDNGIAFVGIAYLDQGPAARRYLEEFNITYPNGRDKGGDISRRYAVTGVPVTYFVQPDGKIVGKFTGPLEHDRLYTFLEQIRP